MVYHSSVFACHGSLPATRPLRSDVRQFQTTISTPIESTNEPSVAIWFISSQPGCVA